MKSFHRRAMKLKKKYFLFFLIVQFSLNLFAQPTISSFSPVSGPVGTSVTINGSNFSTTAANNIVFFGAVRASVTTATSASLTVTVPAGATYQPITVTVSNLTAYSNKPFIVTFSGAAPQFTSQSFQYAARVDSVDTDQQINEYAIGDIDNDGKIDVITANELNDNISVYKNTTAGGNISFAPRVNFLAGDNPKGITIGDVDGDGKLDVVVVNYNDHTVSIFKNTSSAGVISFASKVDFTTAAQPYAVVIADLDKDGKPDLAVNTGGIVDGYLSVLRNISSSSVISFASKVDLAIGGGSLENFRTADLDGDEKIDIIYPNYFFNSIYLFRNLSTPGNISFAAEFRIITSADPDQLEIGDLNDDGKPDLAVSYAILSDDASVFRNTSSVGSIAFTTSVDYPTGKNTDGITINDLDGDGKPDMAVCTLLDSVLLFKNTAVSGGAISFSSPSNFAANWEGPIFSADFDNDGKPDISLEGSLFRVVILKNNTTGPQITSFTPVSGAPGTVITIKGYNFSGVNSVSFDGVPASSFSVVNSTTITAAVGPGSSGNITVTAPYGTGTLAGFKFTGPPVITSFNPTSASPDSIVMINGLNFQAVSSVRFGGTPASSYSTISSRLIKAIVGSGSSGDVTATNSYGTGTLPGFTYIRTPKIISFTPSSAGPGTTITIKGINFTGTTSVSFGGTAATSFIIVDSATITAIVGNGASGMVAITNNIGTGIKPGFIFIPAPVITSFTPTTAGSGMTVTIVGNNFTGATSVQFGGREAGSFTVVNATTITAKVLSGASGAVTVITPGGIGSMTGFIFIPAPTLTGFTPKITGQGGTVTIKGTNLSTTSAVSFGGVAASSFTVIDSSTITAVVATGASGYVMVTTIGGNASLYGFYFTGTPVINSFSPVSGTIGTVVTIEGANFNSTPQNNIVYFGGVKANITSATSNRLIVTVPAGANYQSISVATGGKIAYSKTPFAVTFGGVGSFNPNSFAGRVDFTTGGAPESIASGDLDGDGKPDVVVANTYLNTISFFRNTSTVNNLSFASKIDSVVGLYPHAIRIADIDADGKLDVLLLNYNPQGGGTGPENSITIFKNTSTIGNLSFQPKFVLQTDYHPQELAIADLDLDGKPELSVTHFGTAFTDYEFVSVFTNRTTAGVMSFGPEQRVQSTGSTLTGLFYENSIVAVDIDNDDWTDLIAGFSLGDFVSVIRNNDYKCFGGCWYGSGYANVATADFDGDGKVDVITNDWTLRNTFNGISLTFDIRRLIGIGGQLAIDNLSGDIKPDFARINPAINTISAIKNLSTIGTLSFAAKVDYNTGTAPGRIITSDFNGDGKADIAITNGNFNTFSILLNNIGNNGPSISAFSPINGSAGTVVTITGTNLTGTTGVSFGGVAASSFTVVNATTISAVVGNGNSGNVSVTTPTGTVSLGWFYHSPSITSFTPTNAGTGITVTITGKHFTGATAVSFGGVAASSFTVLSPTMIAAVVANGSSGEVSVTTPGGTGTLPGFTYVLAPSIASFTPMSGGIGTTVTITGRNFTGTTAVTFGGVAASSFIIVNDSTITAIVGTGATGNIKVTTPGGTASSIIFTFTSVPTIISFSPTSASTGDTIIVTGTNFTGATSVSLGGIAATSFTVVNSTTIKAVVASGASGNVSVTTPGGTATKSGFTFNVVTAVGNINGSSNELSVYPNPAKDYIIVEHPVTNKSADIRLVDIFGRVMKIVSVKRNISKTQVNTESLAAGVYKIIWSDGRNSLTKTVMILK